MKRTNTRGNTFVLLLAVSLALLLAVGFLVMNYNQLMGVHKETLNAADATALQVAVDMARVVVDGPLGRIGMVDDPASTSSPYPIQGINTIYAELRLNALVASKLSQNSKTNLLYLVRNDLTYADLARDTLRQKITAAANGASVAYDKNGTVINFLGDAQKIYQQNQIRLGKSSGTPIISITVGTVNRPAGTGETTTPMPYADANTAASGDVIS